MCMVNSLEIGSLNLFGCQLSPITRQRYSGILQEVQLWTTRNGCSLMQASPRGVTSISKGLLAGLRSSWRPPLVGRNTGIFMSPSLCCSIAIRRLLRVRWTLQYASSGLVSLIALETEYNNTQQCTGTFPGISRQSFLYRLKSWDGFSKVPVPRVSDHVIVIHLHATMRA